jgi:hypothetical protein
MAPATADVREVADTLIMFIVSLLKYNIMKNGFLVLRKIYFPNILKIPSLSPPTPSGESLASVY